MFFMVAALLPQSSWATVTVVFSGDNNEIATVTTDDVNGEPFDFTSLSSDDQNKFRSCTTVNFTGKFTSISDLPDNPVTVSYNSTTIAVSNEKFTVSASDGQADLTVLRPLLIGKKFDFDSGITSVDYATYSLEFSDNQTTVDIIAKDGSAVALTQTDSEKDVLFINSHCTTIKFSGDGVFSDLTAFTNGNKEATTIDFSEANFSNASVMTFKYWGATITTGNGSASLDTYPDDVIQSCNNLTTLTFGNGIATIDRTTNPRTITFTSSSYDIKYSRVEAAFNRDGYNDYTKVFDQSVTSIDMGDYVFNFSGNYENTTNCYDGVTIIAKAGKSVSLNAGNQGSMLYTIKENCTSVAFRGEVPDLFPAEAAGVMPVREGALRSRRRIARQSQDCLRMRSLRALGLHEQCARLRGLFRPPLHGVFACTETALSAAAPRLRHKTRDCIAQRPAILRTEYRPSAADALRVAFARPAGPRSLAPRRGFPSGSPLSVA